MNNRYDTLSLAIKALDERGYTADFTLQPDCLEIKDTGKKYGPNDFEVEEYHRFEGESNPADMSIVYAVAANDGTKGTITEAYGAYSSKSTAEMAKKMDITALD